MWKRISAGLFDAIILSTVAVGMALLLSVVLNYDGYYDTFVACSEEYEQTYGVKFDLTDEEKSRLTDQEKREIDDAWQALFRDERVVQAYGMMVSLGMVIITFSVLLAYLVLELTIPLILKNGQTLGKKIFGIAVMREDAVQLTPILLFARTVLGKYAVETMVPVFLVIMIIFGGMGVIGVAVIGGLLVLQLSLLFATRGRTPIHDLLAHTVVVDFASQRIFDSPEELLEYKKRLHAEATEHRER